MRLGLLSVHVRVKRAVYECEYTWEVLKLLLSGQLDIGVVTGLGFSKKISVISQNRHLDPPPPPPLKMCKTPKHHFSGITSCDPARKLKKIFSTFFSVTFFFNTSTTTTKKNWEKKFRYNFHDQAKKLKKKKNPHWITQAFFTNQNWWMVHATLKVFWGQRLS